MGKLEEASPLQAPIIGFVLKYMIQLSVRFSTYRTDALMSDKPLPDLKTFIENVNKKDKPNGKKIRFAFTKRKRK